MWWQRPYKYFSDTPSKPASNTASPTESTTPQTESAPPQSANTTDNEAFTTLAPIKHSTCLLKTVIATVMRTDSQTEISILFDEGLQCSFFTEKLTHTLAPNRWENINLSLFETYKPLFEQMDVVQLNIRILMGKLVQLLALVVSTIATPKFGCLL